MVREKHSRIHSSVCLQLPFYPFQLRYSLLPYWYTLFYQSEKDGSPLVVPLWVEFPTDKTVFETEDEHLVGELAFV